MYLSIILLQFLHRIPPLKNRIPAIEDMLGCNGQVKAVL